MKVKGYWHGGPSYTASSKPEVFASIADAKATMQDRADNLDGYTPCVEDDSMILENMQGQQIGALVRGPRGGIRLEK